MKTENKLEQTIKNMLVMDEVLRLASIGADKLEDKVRFQRAKKAISDARYNIRKLFHDYEDAMVFANSGKRREIQNAKDIISGE